MQHDLFCFLQFRDENKNAYGALYNFLLAIESLFLILLLILNAFVLLLDIYLGNILNAVIYLIY